MGTIYSTSGQAVAAGGSLASPWVGTGDGTAYYLAESTQAGTLWIDQSNDGQTLASSNAITITAGVAASSQVVVTSPFTRARYENTAASAATVTLSVTWQAGTGLGPLTNASYANLVTGPNTAPTLTAVATAGTLANGTWYVQYSYNAADGETVGSGSYQSIATTGTDPSISVSPIVLPAYATSANVYLGAGAGVNTSWIRVSSSWSGVSAYTITSTAGVTASPPASNAGHLLIPANPARRYLLLVYVAATVTIGFGADHGAGAGSIGLTYSLPPIQFATPCPTDPVYANTGNAASGTPVAVTAYWA